MAMIRTTTVSEEEIVLVAGSSGQHAAVVYEAALLSGLRVAGFVTVEQDKPPVVLDCVYLGGSDLLQDREFVRDRPFVAACGSNEGRKSVSAMISELGGRLHSVVHPSAIISPSAAIESGTVVLAGAIVGSAAKIGKSCIVNHAASVGHNCTVADFVNISPGARLAGAVQVEEGVFIGINASVIQGRCLRQGAIIGAGAVVIADVDAGVTVVGNPARSTRG